MFTGGVLYVALLPALSQTVIGVDNPGPSAVTIAGLACDKLPTPDVASVVVNANDTSVVFQPAAFGAGFGALHDSVGGLASRFTVTYWLVVPPADVAVHVNVAAAVSVDNIDSPHPSVDTTDWLSATVKVTRTSDLYQPFVPTVPVTTGVTVGGDASIWYGSVVNVALLPAASVTVTLPVIAAPGVGSDSGDEALVDATPDVASVAV